MHTTVSAPPPVRTQPPKLIDQLRERLRTLHYSLRTEDVYVDWVRRFILFNGRRHPRDMGAPEVEAFLTHLAVERKVSASTQNQARAAIIFLYREVLEGLRLRVKDVDFERREIIVREGKGAKDRVTVLPENPILPLKEQLKLPRALHRTLCGTALPPTCCRPATTSALFRNSSAMPMCPRRRSTPM